MALEQMVTGPYNASYNTFSLGISRDGYTISHAVRQQNIEQTDHYGDSLIDYVYRGGNVSLTFTMMSFIKALDAGVMWPFAASIYTLRANATPVGRLASDLAKPLVMTVSANTPAAAALAKGPASITAALAILSPGTNIEHLYDSRVREVRVSLSLLPYDNTVNGALAAGTVVWATTT